MEEKAIARMKNHPKNDNAFLADRESRQNTL
jgi:hypothetical protein